MNTLEIINKIDSCTNHQVQILLDVISSYFDVSLKQIHVDALTIGNKSITRGNKSITIDELVTEYEKYKNNEQENKFIAIVNSIKEKEINKLIDSFYIGKSANNSSLSFRLALHTKWRFIKLLEEYTIIKLKNDDNSMQNDDNSIQYITNDFFVFVRYCEILNSYIISGPFLKLRNKAVCSNELAIKKIMDFIQPIFDGSDEKEQYPSYGEYLKLGGEYFSCTEDIARTQIELAYASLETALNININKDSSGCFKPNNTDDYPILGKRHWIFFAFSAIFISRYYNMGPSNKTVILFHNYKDEDDQMQSAKLVITIKDNEKGTIEYLTSTDNNKQYLELNYQEKYYSTIKKLIAHLLSLNILENDKRKKLWEQSFINVIKQVERNINSVSNKRIVILEEYLSENWQEFLTGDKILSQNICDWTNNILRGVKTFLYEYSYINNKLYSPTDATYRTKVEKGLQKISTLDVHNRSKHSIAYRCIYKNNRQYVHYQSLHKSSSSEKPELTCIPKEKYFWRTINKAQSSIAHTLGYKGRSLGVIEVQGDSPYYFRHANLYKLRQLATFFGDYFYRAKANKWLQDIIESASHKEESYNLQCKALTNLFFASGAGIWVKDDSIKNSYQLKGFYGSEKISALIEKEPHGNFFKSDNPESNGAKFLTKRKKQVDKNSYFTSEKYTPSDHLNAYKATLIDENFNHILLFAINNIEDTNQSAHAVITIHNKNVADDELKGYYPKTWGGDIAHISQFIASAFSIMHSANEEKRRKTSMLSHDLRTNIGQLEQNSRQMLKRINDTDVSAENKFNFINYVIKKDLQPIVKEAIQQIEILTEDRKKTAKDEFFTLIQQQQNDYYSQFNLQFSSFNLAYNTAFENRNRRYNVHFNELDRNDDWQVKFSLSHLNKILMNLIENAQKYSSEDTTIEPKIYEGFGCLVFELVNYGKKMQETDAFKVFNYKFRGSNSGQNKGKGLGLWQVKHIVELYNDSIFFDYEELTDRKNLARYSVKIQFYDYR